MMFWVIFYLALGVVALYYSQHQPFPEHSSRFGMLMLVTGAIFWIMTQAPRETGFLVPATSAVALGGIFVVIGVFRMAVRLDDVVVAPFGGVLLCTGTLSLMGDRWPEMAQSEQIGSFLLASILVLMEIYLAFRGLVVGVQGITWSKSGLRQVNRGLLLGPRGAISHFERSWDMEDPWINAMSHAALVLIYRHLGDESSAKEHLTELEAGGGWESVDDTWASAITDALSNLNQQPVTSND
ncbi:MAG: hypothetical protein QF365_01410 [Candidatus Thalassarchaeaceae archaeon]|jgi:hypothetical protein|nr:hypothetical protein [Candidatus Thalassarchaeaceae archaeon]MDP6318878.1 hypothetical protein [Candidatus Thalassarchaeaceae archaeon]DAC35995.1 MAG TPA: hypothetical protein D7H79_01690 [Candidatus Poseidoniales archaeon]HIH79918.1 hypothetical protein [Candidatus Thalassarchaeaceae archaeon]HJM29907.1 hypothetical protein [Candidatus Thalassarchaeaceae archaeon]